MTGNDVDDVRGIRRFHKVTISAGVVFCGLMALRFVQSYQSSGQRVYLLYFVIALLAMAGLSVYLWSFFKRGI